MKHETSLSLKTALDKYVARRYVNIRAQDDLRLYKYSKNVFFKQLWREHPDLLEARGTVFNTAGDLISYPFTKVFNHGEMNAGFSDDTMVTAVEKINGFLAVATWYKDDLLVTSSGTFDSDFAKLARKYLDVPEVRAMCANFPFSTWCFEICDPGDQHIIVEPPGAYLIGGRNNEIYSLQFEQQILDKCYQVFLKDSEHTQFYRPHWQKEKYGLILEGTKEMSCAFEGYVCYNEDYTEAVKVKSTFYLTQKFLARTNKDVSVIWTDPNAAKKQFDEEYYTLIDKLPEHCSVKEWHEMKEAERLNLMRCIL